MLKGCVLMAIPAITSYKMPIQSELPKNKVEWIPDPKRAALLIHDMQYYFVNAFTEKQSPRSELIVNINHLKNECRKLGIPIIYSRQPGGQRADQRGLLQDFWGDGVENQLAQTAILDEIAPDESDIVITKWRYSAFKKTNLLNILQESGRDQLIICGIYAHIGCLLTASDAFMKDIQPFFVTDAVADFSLEEHKMAVNYAAKRCAYTISTQNIVSMMNKMDQVLSQGYLPTSLQDVREQIVELMQKSSTNISDHENLMNRGLDSIRIMSLVEQWRTGGAEITFMELIENPTVSGWWHLLSTRMLDKISN